jgi:hypothetical protein
MVISLNSGDIDHVWDIVYMRVIASKGILLLRASSMLVWVCVSQAWRRQAGPNGWERTEKTFGVGTIIINAVFTSHF